MTQFVDMPAHTLPADIGQMTINEVVGRIEKLNSGLASFWANSNGWAPVEAAGLLSKARLDWQFSLSGTLRLWLREPAMALTDGELILAWSNLGSLVEGTLKLLLSVFYMDYQKDLDLLKKQGDLELLKPMKGLYDGDQPKDPGGLMLKPLLAFVKKYDLIGAEGDAFAAFVQHRRNAIHAFKTRPLGDGQEFQAAVRRYLLLLREINVRLPYPDGVYEPQET